MIVFDIIVLLHIDGQGRGRQTGGGSLIPFVLSSSSACFRDRNHKDVAAVLRTDNAGHQDIAIIEHGNRVTHIPER